MEPLLRAEGLSKSYVTGKGRTLEVLRDLDLSVSRGQVVAIVGESGTGKSTLLHILGALDRPTHGHVFFDGESTFDKSDEELAQFRNREVGFVFQFHHLLPEFDAVENVAMPALIAGERLDDVRARAVDLLEMLGLGERLKHRPSALSGGEKQRVAVARALMNTPALIIADEPTGNLDTNTADVLHEEIFRLSRELSQTFVIATHNPALADMADRTLSMELGRLEVI